MVALRSLRKWFVFHGVVDFIFGIPLLLFPSWILSLFHVFPEEFVMARLVGAALLGIGGASLFCEAQESFSSFLNLKIIWSLSALVALGISLFLGASLRLWIIFGIFLGFSFIWVYFKKTT